MLPDDWPLGAGRFAIYLRCRCRMDGIPYAVKVLLRSNPSADTEAELLARCQGHPNIVRLVATLQDRQYTYIVTELLNGGHLTDGGDGSGGDSGDGDGRFVACVRQILSGLAHIHRCGIAHRDLKPANIVFEALDSDRLRIINFGFAKRLTDADGMAQPVFAFDTSAPELLFRTAASPAVTQSCDLWSLGVLVYGLLCQRRPFGDGPPSAVLTNIQVGHYDRLNSGWQRLPEHVQNIIGALLSENVDYRGAAHTALVEYVADLDDALPNAELPNWELPRGGSGDYSHSVDDDDVGDDDDEDDGDGEEDDDEDDVEDDDDEDDDDGDEDDVEDDNDDDDDDGDDDDDEESSQACMNLL